MTEIFKTDSKGKLRVIRYSTDGNTLVMESGLVGGNLARNETTCQPKNIGRSNATTGAEQAISMMESKIRTKTRKEYHMTQKDALNGADDIFPMLAKDYAKEARKVVWAPSRTFVQPKLDGIRCLAFVEDGNVKMMSRSNKEIITLPHIVGALSYCRDGIYDGELYGHGLSFQENMKLIKKDRGEASRKIGFHMYDMVSENTFPERYHMLEQSFNIKNGGLGNVPPLLHLSVVPSYKAHSEQDLKDYHDEFIGRGYEGAILRWGEEEYKSKGRSSHLLKFKRFDDMDSVVIDVVPYEARPTHGMLKCIDHLGIEFTADFSGSHAEREVLLTYKGVQIGKTVEIRYFGRTDDRIPRFAKAVAFKN